MRQRLKVAAIAVCLAAGVGPRMEGAPADLAARGEKLFTGETRLRNGGPACVSCHDIAGLPFPGGGTMGPNLTQAYGTLGLVGTQAAMQTLYFGVMSQIYDSRPLTPLEQAEMVAFFARAQTQPPPRWSTQLILLAALLVAVGFVALTGFLWRDRVRSVRGALVAKATRRGAF